nr:hypothetical protein [Tanacetum cinerariifolium]
MDDDLFTYEVEVANIPCDSNKDDDSKQRMSHEADDDTRYDPSDVSFTEWLGGDDEVELTDEDFSNNEDDVAEVFRIDTSIFNFETPMYKAFNEFNYLLQIDPDLLTKDIIGFKTYEDYKDDWIYEWNENVPWVYDKTWLDNGIWKEPKLVKHTCKPFNYKTGCSEWPTYSWREDGYCNRGNLPELTKDIIGFKTNEDYKDDWIYEWNENVPWVYDKTWLDNGIWKEPKPVKHTCKPFNYKTGCSEWPTYSWREDELEWYEALEDSELKDEALRNKAI